MTVEKFVTVRDALTVIRDNRALVDFGAADYVAHEPADENLKRLISGAINISFQVDHGTVPVRDDDGVMVGVTRDETLRNFSLQLVIADGSPVHVSVPRTMWSDVARLVNKRVAELQ